VAAASASCAERPHSEELQLDRKTLVTREGRTRVRSGRDPHARAVRHAHALAMTLGDRARSLDDHVVERRGILEKRVNDQERGHDRDVAVLEQPDRLFVEQRRVFDRVDPGLGGDLHAAGAVRVGRDAQPDLVRLLDRGGGLGHGVLGDLGRRPLA